LPAGVSHAFGATHAPLSRSQVAFRVTPQHVTLFGIAARSHTHVPGGVAHTGSRQVPLLGSHCASTDSPQQEIFTGFFAAGQVHAPVGHVCATQVPVMVSQVRASLP
jgi:hypothetical protein